jgi:hypothetical protein
MRMTAFYTFFYSLQNLNIYKISENDTRKLFE